MADAAAPENALRDVDRVLRSVNEHNLDRALLLLHQTIKLYRAHLPESVLRLDDLARDVQIGTRPLSNITGVDVYALAGRRRPRGDDVQPSVSARIRALDNTPRVPVRSVGGSRVDPGNFAEVVTGMEEINAQLLRLRENSSMRDVKTVGRNVLRLPLLPTLQTRRLFDRIVDVLKGSTPITRLHHFLLPTDLVAAPRLDPAAPRSNVRKLREDLDAAFWEGHDAHPDDIRWTPLPPMNVPSDDDDDDEEEDDRGYHHPPVRRVPTRSLRDHRRVNHDRKSFS